MANDNEYEQDSEVVTTEDALSRREFLQASIGAMAVGSVPFACDTPDSASSLTDLRDGLAGGLANHRAVTIRSLHAYADKWSVRHGEKLTLHVSSDVPYRLDILRCGSNPDGPGNDDDVIVSSNVSTPRIQPIHPGSYVLVQNGLSGALPRFSVECWVRPFRLDRWAGLVTQYDYPNGCSFGLFIAEGGRLGFYLGSGGAYRADCMHLSSQMLVEDAWNHVLAAADGPTRAIYVNGRLDASLNSASLPAAASQAPIRLGAYASNGVAFGFFDGDLSRPVIHNRVLVPSEVARQFEDRGRTPPTDPARVAHWPLSETQGDQISESVQGRTGRIVNHATRMIGGPALDGDQGPYTDPFRGRLLALSGTSYIRVPRALPATTALPAFTVEGWVRLRRLGWATVLSQHDYPSRCGVGLFVDDRGAVVLLTGQGQGWDEQNLLRSAPATIETRQWYHIAATWDGQRRSIVVNGVEVAASTFTRPVIAGTAPLRIGAYGSAGSIVGQLHGELIHVAWWDRRLSLSELSSRFAARATEVPAGASLSGGWPLQERSGSIVSDTSSVRPGTLVDRSAPKWLPLETDGPAGSLALDAVDSLSAAALPNAVATNGLTFQIWVRLSRNDAFMGLLAQHDYPNCGLALLAAPNGGYAWVVGDGAVWKDARMLASAAGTARVGVWQHVVGTWDAATQQAALYVDGVRVAGPTPIPIQVRPTPGPVRIGAYSSSGARTGLLSGDVAMASVLGRCLTAGEVATAAATRGRTPPSGSVFSCWPLDDGAGSTARDLIGRAPATIEVTAGSPRAAWRSGSPVRGTFSPADDTARAERGHAIRFAADDLYDCRWAPSHEFVPAQGQSAPGLHVARFTCTRNGVPHRYDVPFLVRRASSASKANVLVLAATHTWRAYNTAPFLGSIAVATGAGGTATADSTDVPGYSAYSPHGGGAPGHLIGTRLPCTSATPYLVYDPASRYSHLLRQERFTHIWLEREGYDYDLASDEDLEREPDLLTGYNVVILPGHSEYWSRNNYDRLRTYLDGGGNVISLSGNTMFWRVSFDADLQIMECRKDRDNVGGIMKAADFGDGWHEQDRRKGGLTRDCGMPAMPLLGLEFLGWCGTNPRTNFGSYVARAPTHPLFTTPQATGLTAGQAFGRSSDGSGAVGHEIDATYATYAALDAQKSATLRPGHPVFPMVGADVFGPNPATAYAGIVLLADSNMPTGATGFDPFCSRYPFSFSRGADLIYWERPSGGRVLNFGSINVGHVLHSGSVALETLMRNVLDRFGA